MGKIVKLSNFLPPEIQEDVMKEQPLLMHHTQNAANNPANFDLGL